MDGSTNNMTYNTSYPYSSDSANLLANEDDGMLENKSDIPACLVSSTPNVSAACSPNASSINQNDPCESYSRYATYDSFPQNGSTIDAVSPSPHTKIYCIHGKAGGCCIVSEGVVDTNLITMSDTPGETVTYYGEHCHPERNLNVDQRARRKLIIASVLCVVFMIGEVVGGILSSSLAIATDAAHLLTDFASFMISLFSIWVASRAPTKQMSFGWYRAEVIGALTSVLLIWIVTGVLVYLAVERIILGQYEIDAEVMLIVSGVGVIVNLIMGAALHQHHGAGHGHSHNSSISIDDSGESGNASRSKQNINVRAAFIHVIGDLIQSCGVLVAALIIFFKPDWKIVDPICTFLFSALVLFTTFAIIKDALLVLMEGMPKGIDFTEVMNLFLKIDGVLKVHNLRIWALSLDKTALSAHLAIKPGVSPQKILKQASRSMYSKYNFFEMTLQVEEFDENMRNCTQCKCPEK